MVDFSAPQPVSDSGLGPEALHPEALDPATLDPEALESASLDLEALDLEALDPAALDPATLDSEALDSAALDSATLDPATLDPATLDPEALDPEALESASDPDLETDAGAATRPRSPRSPGESLRRRWWRRKFMPALLRSLGRSLENWADRLEDRVVQVTTTLPGELRQDWGARVLRWRLAVGVRLGAMLGGWWGIIVAIGVGVGLLVWGGPGAGGVNWGSDSGADFRTDPRADRVETEAVAETKAIAEATTVSADSALGAEPETAPDASQPRSSLSPVPESGSGSEFASEAGSGVEFGSQSDPGSGLAFSGAIADRTLDRSEPPADRAPDRGPWPLDILEIDLNPPSANAGLALGWESSLEAGLDFSLEAGWGDAPVLAWQEENQQQEDQQKKDQPEADQPEADQNNSPVSGQILDPPLGPPLPPDPIATLTAHLTADLTHWLHTHPDFPQPPAPASSWLVAITPDQGHQRLRVVIAPGWDSLAPEQQAQWVAQLQTQAMALQVRRWELWDGDRHLLARSPVVGQSPLIFRRSSR